MRPSVNAPQPLPPHFRLRSRALTQGLAALGVAVAVIGLAWLPGAVQGDSNLNSAFASSKNLWIDRAVLQGLPTSGGAWDRLAADARGSWGTPNISDQESQHDVKTFAGALVAVRTNDTAMRNRVVEAIEGAIDTENGGRTLALGRNLTGYVLAADLIGYDSSRFHTWLDGVRTENLDGRTLISTNEDRPNNWGTHAGAARIAAARFLDDASELDRAAMVFRGFLGDRGAYASFQYGDAQWQADPAAPVGINPLGATKNGYVVDGAIVDDIRRCECLVSSPAPKENYQWEGMQGIVTQATLLDAAGRNDVWGWSNAAIRRAASFLYQQASFPAEGDDTFLTYLIDAHVGTTYAGGVVARSGKSVGYTDWTHVQNSAGTTTTQPIVTVPPPTTSTPTIVTVPPPTTATPTIVTVPPSTTTMPPAPIVTVPPSTSSPTTSTTPIATTLPSTTSPPIITTPPSTTSPPIITTPPSTTTPPTTTVPPLTSPNETTSASGEVSVQGTTTGRVRDTWARDGRGQTVTEEQSRGKRSRRHDMAEHHWTLPTLEGRQVLELSLTAGPDAGDADDGMQVDWSSDGERWTPIAFVKSGNTLDTAIDVGTPSGVIHVRVADSNRTSKNSSVDSITVDFLQIRTGRDV